MNAPNFTKDQVLNIRNEALFILILCDQLYDKTDGFINPEKELFRRLQKLKEVPTEIAKEF